MDANARRDLAAKAVSSGTPPPEYRRLFWTWFSRVLSRIGNLMADARQA